MSSQGVDRTIIAIPIAEGRLCSHFGHCQQFALYDVDVPKRQIHGTRFLDPPPHEPGLLPRWLHGENARVVIAGGMGQRAQEIFGQQGIEVIVGTTADRPEAVVQAFLDGKLTVAANPCDH